MLLQSQTYNEKYTFIILLNIHHIEKYFQIKIIGFNKI
jgi:hypothetical protein